VSVAAIQTYKPGDHPFQETLDGFGIVLLVMAVASLGLSTFLVVNTINAIIAQQIPQIGIMKTVGGIRSEIAQLYLAGVAVYGFLSLVLAVPLGAFGGDILSRGLLTTLNIPVAPFEVLPISFVYQILAGLLTPLLAALWPVVQGTAISVREAIASYGLGQGKYGGRLMDKIMGRVQGLPRMLTLALRNTFRRMGRVILTEITLVAAGAIFMMIVATSSSFNSTLDEFWKGFGFDVLMGFNQPQRIDKVIPQIEAHSGVQFAEMWIWQSAKIKKVGATGPGSELKIDLRAVPEDTKLYTPQLTAGRALDPNDGHALLMDQKMAKELGISVGDHVVLTFVGAGESQWTVVGLIFDVIGNLAFVTGAFWDEVWHRLYGIGSAVNDFLWRPHLMIYGSMGLTALFAFGGLFIALRGQGDVRARFRSEPLIGLLGLAASYLACSTFSDLIWHQIYGLDITAWSLPHIFLGTGSAFVMLATVALLAAQVSRRDWRGLAGLQLPETLAIVMTGAAAMITAQVAATEWDGIRVIGDPNRIAFWARPEWIYPVVVISLAVFFSAFLIQALRRAGVATLTTLAALGVRALYFALFGLWENRTGMALTAQLLMIPAAVALDAWYAFRLKRAGEAATLTLGNLLAGVAFVIISLPLIPRLMIYPRLNAGTLPMMVGFSLLAALWFGWIGARLGAWLGGLGGEAKESAEAMSPRISRRTLRVGLGMLAAFILFALLFILTARPPNT
jgi:ABC-type lipoprotein release transport system permease subunit